MALCDFRSVDPKRDAFPVALVYPDHEGETMAIRYNPKHEWKYVRGMTPDEIVLIKWFVHGVVCSLVSSLISIIVLIPCKTVALLFSPRIPVSKIPLRPKVLPTESRLS